MRYIGLAFISVVAAAAFAQPGADFAYEAPVSAKNIIPSDMSALPLATIQTYTTQVDQLHVFTPYLGKNNSLKSEESNLKVLRIGAGFATDMTDTPLFGDGFADEGFTVYLAAIASADATGLRLIVDLSGLKDGEEVYVVDTEGNRAFGPYTKADYTVGGTWLPTTGGDTAILVARTTGDTVPDVKLEGVSHLFRSTSELKLALSCNNDINCESNTTLQTLSTGVGIMVIPQSNFDSALCSGALINNADTPANEPYYLTSWHCVPDYAQPNQVDILWDFRTSSCNANDPPSFSSLPRSNGTSLIASNGTLDITLMLLDNVPNGPKGRAYLGWETRTPSIGEGVVDIHYPRGEYMRISYGHVQGLNLPSSGFLKQTYIKWDDGVTEGGSSGSPLLLANSNYRICGTLSNGPTHSCTNTTYNEDYFSSFRDFYSTVQSYLSGTEPGPIPDTSIKLCPAEKAFKDYPGAVEALRAFRDRTLQPTAMGQGIVSAYYYAAPYLANAVDASPLAAQAFRSAASPFVSRGEATLQSIYEADVVAAPVAP